MSFSDREKQLIRAAFAWGQTAQREGYVLTDWEIEKSVLFRRLLSGRPPLLFPPPLRHGFPWYEVIEGRAEHVVNAMEAPAQSGTGILIDGSLWRLVQTLTEGEDYIVAWGDYPMRWRLRKHWKVNSAMTRQLRSFRSKNPGAAVGFEGSSEQRECDEFRIDEQQTVSLGEWQLSRIGLSGWVWVGTPVAPPADSALCPLHSDPEGPLLIGEQNRERGAGWLRMESADGEFRFLKLGQDLHYQSLIETARSNWESLLHGVEGDQLEIMDWCDQTAQRQFEISAQLVPLENFGFDGASLDLLPENLAGC
ncbi:hypothetical protein [Microbulbifer sp. TYP-18]|uniref:hypothetical protein n=1 Tax=Microbulbifer sp. TYP-18 TaxID=3230024 RepID=UPI0034C5CF09